MGPKRRRSSSSFKKASEPRIEIPTDKDELEDANRSDAENDGEELSESKSRTQLCGTCEVMTSYKLGRLLTRDGAWHYGKLELEDSAKSGCNSCVLLWAEASGPGDWGQAPPWNYWDRVVREPVVNAMNAQEVPIIEPYEPDLPIQPAAVFVGQNKLDNLRFQRPNSNEQSFPAIERR